MQQTACRFMDTVCSKLHAGSWILYAANCMQVNGYCMQQTACRLMDTVCSKLHADPVKWMQSADYL